MQTPEQVNQRAADLYWLAYLLTGDRQPSLDITLESLAQEGEDGSFFSNWMDAWSRRVVISKALSSIRERLQASSARTAARKPAKSRTSFQSALADGPTKAQIESALLSIDTFPRCALVLTVFERMSLDDAAVLLDADRTLLKKAQVIGLQELNWRLHPQEKPASEEARPLVLKLETRHA